MGHHNLVQRRLKTARIKLGLQKKIQEQLDYNEECLNSGKRYPAGYIKPESYWQHYYYRNEGKPRHSGYRRGCMDGWRCPWCISNRFHAENLTRERMDNELFDWEQGVFEDWGDHIPNPSSEDNLLTEYLDWQWENEGKNFGLNLNCVLLHSQEK